MIFSQPAQIGFEQPARIAGSRITVNADPGETGCRRNRFWFHKRIRPRNRFNQRNRIDRNGSRVVKRDWPDGIGFRQTAAQKKRCDAEKQPPSATWFHAGTTVSRSVVPLRDSASATPSAPATAKNSSFQDTRPGTDSSNARNSPRLAEDFPEAFSAARIFSFNRFSSASNGFATASAAFRDSCAETYARKSSAVSFSESDLTFAPHSMVSDSTGSRPNSGNDSSEW